MTFLEFIAAKQVRSLYIDHPGWDSLYIRKTDYCFSGIILIYNC